MFNKLKKLMLLFKKYIYLFLKLYQPIFKFNTKITFNFTEIENIFNL